jgi:hypothetical protein
MTSLDPMRFISNEHYNALNDDEKEVYMRGVTDTIVRIEEIVTEYQSRLYIGTTFSMDVSFVGMRFHGGHIFQPNDIVTLEREYLNEHDAFAVRVMVLKDGIMQHVAHVDTISARALRRYHGLERTQLQFLRNYPASAKYRVIFEW